ncbi:O-unit flippase-like protein [Trichococcus flocculiformis]|uniref:O-unit flippase-like protein n=1 Tax=Trichococcus flocculiformis TaxID=82803 RepID=UPI002AABD22A|nr:O-unit flippase-like protein [Trichococcus flocculiformis]
MINIKKVDVFISYLGYGFRLISNLIVLPIILSSVSSEEYGLWAIFLSIGALASLFDFGLGSVLTRYTTFAYSGAEEIPIEGMPTKKENGSPNYELLFKLFITSKKMYKKISLIVFFVLNLMVVYIIRISTNDIEIIKVVIGWEIYSIGIALGFYFNYYNSFIKGLGKIKEIEVVGIINRVIYILMQILFIDMGLSFIGLGLANLLSIIFLRFQLSKHINELINSKRSIFTMVENSIWSKSDEQINLALRKNSSQIGLVTISNYLQGQGSLLLLSAFVPLDITARYSLSMQLISIVTSIAVIPFNTYLPQLSSFQVQRNYSKLKNTYIFITVMLSLTYLIGSLTIIVFGHAIINIMNSNTNLLGSNLLVLLCIYQYVLTNHQRATSFIAVGNEQPFVVPYLLSSLLSLVFILVGFMFGMDLVGFILINLIVQIMYNGWKWPTMAFKKINFKPDYKGDL